MSKPPPESGVELQPLITHRSSSSSFDHLHPRLQSTDIFCTNADVDRKPRTTTCDSETEHNPRLQEVGFGDNMQKPVHMEAPDDQESSKNDHRDRASGDINDQESDTDGTTASPAWQPTWLHRVVFAAFFALFSALTVGISALLSFSEHNDGVSDIRQSFAYAWRFGPMIVLTVVAALWTRVELQAMRYMPAIAISADEEPHEHTYSLDYMSLLYPKAIIRAIRQKHHLVYITSCISILLKAQVALAPGLFNIIDVQMEHPTATDLLDSFNTTEDFSDSYGTTGDGDGSPYYIMRAIQDLSMMYPFGMGKNIAYQTFSMSGQGPSGDGRGTTDVPLKIIVDGLFLTHTAKSWKVYLLSRKTSQSRRFYQLCTTSTYRFKGAMRFSLYLSASLKDRETTGLFNTATSNDSYTEFSHAAAVICSPVAWLQQVEVSDDGISPSIKLLPGARKSEIAADMWSLMRASFPRVVPFTGPTSDNILGPLALERDKGKTIDPLDTSIYDSDVLINSTVDLFQDMGPFIAHYNIRQKSQASLRATGVLVETRRRLGLSRRVGGAMIAIFSITTLLNVIIILKHGRIARLTIWHRDPVTIFGSMAFLHRQNRSASGARKHAAALRSEQPNTIWNASSYLPLVLRSGTRLLVAAFLISLIACVITTQRLSDTSHGLTSLNLAEGSNIHLLWTSFPALVLLLVSLYTSSCAMALRALHAFWLPSLESCNTTDLDRSLLDMLSIRALYRSIRLGAHAITVSQLLAFACAVLTTLASVLLTPEEFTPLPKPTKLQQATRFGTQPLDLRRNPAETRNKLSSLLLRQGDANFTYPRNTYDDLLFPALQHGHGSTNDGVTSKNFPSLPAAQIRSQCYRLPVDPIGNLPPPLPGMLTFGLAIPCICENGTRFHHNYTMDFYAHDRNESLHQIYAHFGFTFPGRRSDTMLDPECQPGLERHSLTTPVSRTSTHVWGSYSLTERNLTSLSAWQCRSEWFEVSTNTTLRLVDGEWDVDPTNPPRPDYSTEKPWKPAFGVPDPLYLEVAPNVMRMTSVFPQAVFTDNQVELSDQVAILVQPYGPFQVEDLGNADKEEAILAGLRRDFGFAAAQLANVENRVAIIETSGTEDGPELPEVHATVNYKPQLRLVQNAGPAYAIVAILPAVLLANLWNLCSAAVRRFGGETRKRSLLDMDVRGIAPEDSGSFAAMASLLRDSNVYDHLPPNIELLSDDELHGMLSHLRFRMGWFQKEEGSEAGRHFTIGVLEDPNTVFLGGKRDVAEIDDKAESAVP